MFDRQIVVAVDFDGTITERDAYPEGMTAIRPDAKALIDNLRTSGCWVTLWTCREGKALTEALRACEVAGITFDSINVGNGRRGRSRKVNADLYVDDRAVTTLADAVRIVRERA